jgi:NAD(P)-dependent dehydrogenase (short-subunit alcohol dehydrogenase family)
MENLSLNTELFNLKDKIAIVTGGCGHLGSSMVRTLLSFNATVVVAGRTLEKFKKVFTEQEQSVLIFKSIDITQSASINNFINEILQDFGRIDILINNATSTKGNSPDNLTDEEWTYTMEGVVGSLHKTIRAVIPHMKKQKSGKIINISSMYGVVSPNLSIYKGDDCEKFLNPPHYGVGKAAIIQLTKYYAVLLGEYNIHVNSVSPGPFPKVEIQKMNPSFISRLESMNPLKKIGKPEDLSGVIVLLSSRASDFITGQNIQVDGGWTIW